jgi:hypothetical protein
MHAIITLMPRKAKENSSSREPSTPTEETILAAFEKLFKARDAGAASSLPECVM